MKCTTTLIITLLIASISASAQSDRDQIEKVLWQFINGTTYNYADSIADAFHPNTPMFLYNRADTLLIMSSDVYASRYARLERGKKNDRVGTIANLEVIRDVAYAKLEFVIPSFGLRFYDLLLMKKIENQWKIISKCTTAEPIPKSPNELIAIPQKEIVLEGLNHPWSMAFLSENDVLIAEKDAGIVRANLRSGERIQISGLPEDVARAIYIDTTKFEKGVFPIRAHGTTQSFNAGWFQILLDPDFAENNYLYLSYAAEDDERKSATKVIRGKLLDNRLQAIEILFLADAYKHGTFHYGGGMVFGPDKKLYIATGERNFFEYLNPEIPVAQDLNDKRGKIIRINRDGSIPDDNPKFDGDFLPGLFATGIRATQGMIQHPESGDIWFTDHGTIQGDELNVLKPGVNYGWPYKTTGQYRSEDYQPKFPTDMAFEDPIYFWEKTIAPTGLTFYNGNAFPQWNGNLIVPGLSRGNLWRLVLKEKQVIAAEELFIDDRVRIRKAIQSPRGQLYILTDEDNGKLIRINNAN